MRLVLDTNAAISGLLWQGNPGKLINAALAALVTLHTSAPLLAELRDVLHRVKFARPIQARGLTATEIFEGYAALATTVVPAGILRRSSTTPMTMRCSRARSAPMPITLSPATPTC